VLPRNCSGNFHWQSYGNWLMYMMPIFSFRSSPDFFEEVPASLPFQVMIDLTRPQEKIYVWGHMCIYV
jgi:hypothetical protein